MSKMYGISGGYFVQSTVIFIPQTDLNFSHLFSCGTIGKTQWGFRSIHSMALALTNCTSDWSMNIDRGNVNTVVFLNIEKLLIPLITQYCFNKLEKYGRCCEEMLLFKSYLKTENSIVVLKIGTHLSNPCSVVFPSDLS